MPFVEHIHSIEIPPKDGLNVEHNPSSSLVKNLYRKALARDEMNQNHNKFFRKQAELHEFFPGKYRIILNISQCPKKVFRYLSYVHVWRRQ